MVPEPVITESSHGMEDGVDLREKALRGIGLQSSYVYGPVSSRRLGLSLGINPLPVTVKVCSFDCLYCQYGLEKPTGPRGGLSEALFPMVSAILAELEEVLKRYPGKIDFLTFSGNGEPTLHPRFFELVEGTVAIRDRLRPESRIALLSNGSTIADDDVRAAIRLLDDPILKLDAGDEASWKIINRPAMGMHLEAIVSAMEKLKNIIIQSLFFEGDGARIAGNTSAGAVQKWLSCVERIRPRSVQIYTLDRVPAISGLRKAKEETLRAILAALEGRGIKGVIF